MPARREDADARRFFDEFECVKAGRFRAMGVVDPAKPQAVIPFPNGKSKLIDVKHTRFPSGGGWSFFVCPGCARRAGKLYLIDDAARCCQCCSAMNIQYRSKYGFSRNIRRRESDRYLDELIAKLETSEPLRLKPTPKPWQNTRAQFVYNSRKLAKLMRKRMISLRLHQLANQMNSGQGVKAYQPLAETRSLIDVQPIWRARTTETLQRALDKAQQQILAALESNDPRIQASAIRLMLRTKQARERGLGA